MSCRETPAGSAFTSWARLTVGRPLQEQSVLSTFHRLRTSYNQTDESDRRVYTREDYLSLIDRQRNRVAANANLTERQRESIRRRLDAAAEQDTPDQSTLYALHNLVPAVRNRVEGRRHYLQSLVSRTGQSYSELEERFTELSRGVTSRNSSGVTNESRERAAQLGLAVDPGSVQAMLQLESEARHIEAARARQQPQRIPDEARTAVPAGIQDSPIPGVRVTAWGYDERNSRLEVSVYDAATGESTVHAYRGVPADVVAGSFTASPARAWYDSVRGNPDYQYEDDDAAALDGAAPNCPSCGRFADTSHSCPPVRNVTRMSRWDARSRWTLQNVPVSYVDTEGNVHDTDFAVRLPAIRRLQAAVQEGPVRLDINTSSTYPADGISTVSDLRFAYRQSSSQDGHVEVEWDEDGELVVSTDSLRCSCSTYQENGVCPHISLIATGVRDRIIRPRQGELDQRRQAEREAAVHRAADIVRQAADQARARDWSADEAGLQEAASTWQRESEVLYSENVAAFVADMDHALLRTQETGEVHVPYMVENALDGMATRESGQAFGVEIEFDLPSSMSALEKREARAQIGRDLFAAGLTYDPNMQGYHASQRRGYTDRHTDARGVGTWSYESDASVEGEIVSPGCYDEPETWENLSKVMNILRRNGAIPSTRTGMHVHVGTGGYDGSPAAYTELARMVTQHEDALFRLGSDPARGTHRNSHYSRPMKPVPPEGFADVSEARYWQSNSGGRTTILNLANVSGGRSDHPEFRVFDGTLDAGAAQAQIKLAVGMVNAAQRNAANGGTQRGQERWGDHVRRSPESDPNGAVDAASMVEGSGTVRSLLDTIFRRRADKAQIAAVFAHTKWTTPKH